MAADPNFTRAELAKMLPSYIKIADCLAGERTIKEKGSIYLPVPNASDKSADNVARYTNYLARAVFYNVARRTLTALVGNVFSREPTITLPPSMELIQFNANGSGIDITQTAKALLEMAVAYGRCGIYVDYPIVLGTPMASKADADRANLRPTINIYKPEDIINWRTKQRGAEHVLKLVVLKEQKRVEEDQFREDVQQQWRVLKLNDDNIFQVEIWSENQSEPVDVMTPLDSTGNPLDSIPFKFIGSTDNDPGMDQPPMQDICDLNIAHFHNSADYEDNVFSVGQLTPWISGLTQEWVKQNLNGVVRLGATSVIPLPTGAEIGILQAKENSMVLEAMKHKEEQMIALGAKLVEPTSTKRTATEASIDEAAEGSVLTSCANNVSTAMRQALEIAAAYMGADPSVVQFELSTDFTLMHMSAEDRKQLMAEYVGGGISFTEYRHSMRRSGIAFQDDAEAKKEIDADAVRSAEVPLEAQSNYTTDNE